MATYNKVNVFVEDIAEKVHNLGADQLVVALCAAANAPSSATAQLSDLTQIAYTNLSSRLLTTSTSAQTAGTYKLVIADLVITASGGAAAPFRYVIIFNDTSTNDRVIGYFDYGTDLTLADGEAITLDFHDTNGLMTFV